uniref:Myb/SANT-like domain-containing protein n=1 Tax=Setaria italica TaxID=4555 RepID=K3Y268_SETIT
MNNRASWDEGTMKTLLDLCIAQKNQFNWSNRCLTKLGWKNVYSSFRAQTGLYLGSKQLQNKLNNLRRTFLSWMALQKQSGLERNTQTGGVAADATYWEEDEKDTSGGDAPPRSKPSSQPTSVKPPPFLDELFELFGHEPQDRGTLLTARGIREATPSVGTEGNAADLDQHPLPASSARAMSKRPAREFSVDSPTKKRSDNLEQYIRELSDSVAKRSQQRADRARGEMVRCMQVLVEDSLQEGSPLYCQALYLCTKNPEYRTAFTEMTTKEGRMNWIQFNWDMLNKK